MIVKKIGDIVLAIIFMLISTSAYAGDDNGNGIYDMGEISKSFTLWGSAGGRHKLKKHYDSVVILEFMNPNCPQTQQMYKNEEVQEIQQLFIIRDDVLWASVVSAKKDSPNYHTPEKLWENTQKTKAYPNTVLLDDKLKVAKMYGITHFPAFVVLDEKHKVVYKGGAKDPILGGDNLTNAIEKILLEEPILVPNGIGIGQCTIN